MGREAIVDGLDVHRVAEGRLLGRGRQTDACLPERGFSSSLTVSGPVPMLQLSSSYPNMVVSSDCDPYVYVIEPHVEVSTFGAARLARFDGYPIDQVT